MRSNIRLVLLKEYIITNILIPDTIKYRFLEHYYNNDLDDESLYEIYSYIYNQYKNDSDVDSSYSVI